LGFITRVFEAVASPIGQAQTLAKRPLIVITGAFPQKSTASVPSSKPKSISSDKDEWDNKKSF
jgi:hypothetical protein